MQCAPRRIGACLGFCALVSLQGPLVGPASAEGASVSLTERVGPEIDPAERSRYGLFPDLEGFEGARFEASKQSYRVIYLERHGGEPRPRTRTVTPDAFRQTGWHLAFTDEYAALTGSDTAAAGATEADLLRRLALRYATRKRYDLARAIAEDLRDGYAAAPAGTWAAEALPRFQALAGPRRALIWPGSLLDQQGRTDLLVFSGYYGLWLGVAIPVALEADDAQAYAAGLLVAPAACVLAAAAATRDAPITRGQATIVALGAHLGTWQGLGWSGLSDADGNAVVAAGVGAGLAGLLVAIPLSKSVGFSEGHAQVMSAAMYWGGWFGAVESALSDRTDRNENRPLVDMLVGSDVGVLAAGLAARHARLSKSRMRLINLCGVLGTAFGGGVALLAEVDDDRGAMALLGAGSAAGLALGIRVTRHHDRGEDLAVGGPGRTLEPILTMRSQGRGRAAVPTAGIHLSF